MRLAGGGDGEERVAHHWHDGGAGADSWCDGIAAGGNAAEILEAEGHSHPERVGFGEENGVYQDLCALG